MPAEASVLTTQSAFLASPGQSTLTSASISPSPNSLLVVVLAGMTGATTDIVSTSTLSGGGLTYTPRQTQGTASPAWITQARVWTAPTGGDPGSFTIGFTLAGNIRGYSFVVYEIDGADIDDPVVTANSQSGSAFASGAQTLTLPAAPTVDDVTLAATYSHSFPNTGPATFTGGGGWTVSAAQTAGQTAGCFNQGYRQDSTSDTISWSQVRPQGSGENVGGQIGVVIRGGDDAPGETVGSLAATAADASADLNGTVVAPTFTGTIDAATADATSDLNGTAAGPAFTGNIAAATADAAADLSGEVVAPVFTGSIAAVAADATSAISGEVSLPGVTGSIAATTDAATADLNGAVAAPAVTGSIDATAADAVGDINGTSIPPPITGTLEAATGDATANLNGTAAAPGEIVGSISATTGAAAADLNGETVAPMFVGSIDVTVDGATSNISGSFTQPAFVGAIEAAVADAVANLNGTVAAPVVTGTFEIALDDATMGISLANFGPSYTNKPLTTAAADPPRTTTAADPPRTTTAADTARTMEAVR